MQTLHPHSISTSRKNDFERNIILTNNKPARAAGLCSVREERAHRLTVMGPVGITSFTQTASGPLKYEVSVALRRASMLSCCFPEVALAKPGSSNTTHESLSISVKLIETSGLSVFTRISVPARTVL